MQLEEQFRTPHGQFPPTGAVLKRGDFGGGSESLAQLELEFDFGDISDSGWLERLSGKQEMAVTGDQTDLGETNLENIAFLAHFDEKGRMVINLELMERIAGKAGPLFGANKRERVVDWLSEWRLATEVIGLQEVLNGGRSYEEVLPFGEEEQLVAKSEAQAEGSSNTFTLYAYQCPLISGADVFYKSMPEGRSFKKFVSKGVYDYAFINCEKSTDQEGVIDITIISCKHEMTPEDFKQAFGVLLDREQAYEVDESASSEAINQAASRAAFDELCESAARELGVSRDLLSEGYLGLSGRINAEDLPITRDDAPHLQKLVQAIVSLKLDGIGVDVYRSTESDNFMVFPTYSSYLWFKFAGKLGQVKIGRCEECGRGFSLTGHRGIPRRFCSQECKTKAKYRREAAHRDKARKLFIEQGKSVKDTAESVFDREINGDVRGNERKTLEQACDIVRSDLRKSKELKGLIRKELKNLHDAGENPVLTKRCAQEGIFEKRDLQRLLRERPDAR